MAWFQRLWILFLVLIALPCQAAPSLDATHGRVAAASGLLLEEAHFSKHRLDDVMSREFLDCYLETLDPGRYFFLQSDVDEFVRKYGSGLDDAVLAANVEPAREIFDRLLQRTEERVRLAKSLLDQPLSFTGSEKVVTDRTKAPWPANEADAKDLWTKRVKFEVLQERLHSKDNAKAVDLIRRRYERFLDNLKDTETDALMQMFLSSLAHAYDPHSEYLAPSDIEEFSIQMKLSMEGIGAVLMSDDGYAKIVELVPGGAAALDGRLNVNDRIMAVGQGNDPPVDVVNMRLNKVVKYIRGPSNTEVVLVVWPAGATDPAARKEVRIKRAKIQLTERAAKAKIAEIGKMRLGIINVPSFYVDMRGGADANSVARDVRKLIEKLNDEKVDGMLIDLRGDTGGSLEEVVKMTGFFIKEGPVVQVKDNRNQLQTHDDDDSQVLYGGPLVVLVDRLSASASEIFAAAMQDYGRAVIVGDQSTFGKGTVQKLEDISRLAGSKNGGALKYTIQKFYRVSGGSTQYRGVVPDIQIPSILDVSKISESSLKNPLPFDEIQPAKFQPEDQVRGKIPALREASAKRVATHPEFRYAREDVERIGKELADPTVSLNEEDRKRNLQQAEDRENRRKQERAKRPASSFRVIDLETGKPDEKPKRRPGEEDDPSAPSITDYQQAVLEEGLSVLVDLIGTQKSAK